MAPATSHSASSPYYPPRARWYSPVLYGVDAIHRRLGFLSITLPNRMDLGALVAGFLVPGLAVYLRSPGRVGKAALAASLLLLLAFGVGFGHAAGNIAFGMLLSLHTSGFVYYCSPWVGESLQRRLLLTVLVLLALGLAVYMPARTFLERDVLMPLRIHDKVVIVRPLFPTDVIRPGDWVAYNLEAIWSGADDQTVDAEAGIGLGPVLAVPGDRVEFFKSTFNVNGVPRPRLTYMPQTGALTVPRGYWFIWPRLAASGHGNVAEARIASTLLQMALVAKTQLIGKPFERWLWHRQHLS